MASPVVAQSTQQKVKSSHSWHWSCSSKYCKSSWKSGGEYYTLTKLASARKEVVDAYLDVGKAKHEVNFKRHVICTKHHFPPPPPPPPGISIFFKNWENSPGWGHISCLNAPGWGRRKRANAPSPGSSFSNTSAVFFINQCSTPQFTIQTLVLCLGDLWYNSEK